MLQSILYKSLLLICLMLTVACADGTISTVESKKFLEKKIDKFLYSQEFANRFNLDENNSVKSWRGMLAVKIYNNPDSKVECSAKIYLGNEINFDYPRPDNFINIWGSRFEEVFFFTDELAVEDTRMHAKLAFDSANRIYLHGVHEGNIIIQSGYNINYVMKDIANGITFIQTQSDLCSFFSDNYEYYLLLKPKGINKSEDFYKFRLPINL